MSLHHKLNPTLKHLNPFIIQSMLIHSYGKTGTEAIYCSEDPEEEIAKALFIYQTYYSQIIITDAFTGEILEEIPLSGQLTKQQEEFLNNFSPASMWAAAC